jgi:hypothetical protein
LGSGFTGAAATRRLAEGGAGLAATDLAATGLTGAGLAGAGFADAGLAAAGFADAGLAGFRPALADFFIAIAVGTGGRERVLPPSGTLPFSFARTLAGLPPLAQHLAAAPIVVIVHGNRIQIFSLEDPVAVQAPYIFDPGDAGNPFRALAFTQVFHTRN